MTYDVSYRRILARMGYYNYQNGLIHHHISQEEGWTEHQEHTRNFILKAINLHKPEKITVLGSGWLLELPFAEIIESLPKIILIDIIHPPDVVQQVKELKNVELVEQDVTGGLIAEVWSKTRKPFFKKKLRTLVNVVMTDFNLNDPGMVISLNLLTQLEVLLIRFIRSRADIDDEELTSFRTEIQKRHLNFLLKHKSVVITDVADLTIDKSGVTRTTPTLFTGLKPGRINEEWTWNFDKAGGELFNYNSQFKVKAVIY